MTIRIRPANILDAEALLALQGSGTAPHSPNDERAWQELLANPGPTNTWIAEDDDAVGFIHVEAVGPGFPALVRVNELTGTAQTRTALLEYSLGDFAAYAEVPADDAPFWLERGFSEREAADGVVVVVRGE